MEYSNDENSFLLKYDAKFVSWASEHGRYLSTKSII